MRFYLTGEPMENSRSSQVSPTSNPCDDQNQLWTWPSGSPSKWVLCGSALSAEEKVTAF